jgi:phosphatidylethanolamine/phosphatidyl-N-methylethanolamine N-methyltransferase
MATHLQEQTTGPLYDAWAKVYDGTFGRLVHKRHIAAVEHLRAGPGDRVLDLGVGTGMTLPEYPEGVRVLGLDLSAGMLGKAAAKVDEHGLDTVSLVRGDALRTPFADGSFDSVMITHVISVVSDPAGLMAEARRLVKPDGVIVLLNHFLSGSRPVAAIEKAFNPVFVKVGWKSDLTLADCTAGVDVHVRYQFKLATADLWRIVVLAPGPSPVEAAPEVAPDNATTSAASGGTG